MLDAVVIALSEKNWPGTRFSKAPETVRARNGIFKALVNEDTLLRTHKLGNICCGHKMFLNKIRNIFCVPDTKFVSATNVARGETRKHLCRQQCARNNVSSFARAFSSSVSKDREVYAPETSCMKGTSLHVKNMRIKELCNRKVPGFVEASQARKVSPGFPETGPRRLDKYYSLLVKNYCSL